MNREKKNNSIISEHGCLTPEGIMKYLSGELPVHENDLIEKHIQTCKLCYEAVQGARLFSDPDQYNRGIDLLKSKWNARKTEKIKISRAAFVTVISVAASLLLIAGIYFILRNLETSHKQYYATIFEKGSAIDTLIHDPDIALIPYDELPVENKREESERKKFRRINKGLKEETIPLAMLNDTRIVAGSTGAQGATETEIPKKIVPARREFLRYPFRVTSMPPPENDADEERNAEREFYSVVEDMPKFHSGGTDNISDYIRKKMRYPAQALEKHLSGRVYVRFTINERGELHDATILKSVHPILDNEVLRVIENSPPWIPGRHKGKPVAVMMVMPVDFVLY
jgi:TonB family protein